MVYCVYMLIEYCRTVYPVDLVRDTTPALDPKEIKEFIKIRPMGWAVDENDIEALSAAVSPIEFELQEYERSPSAQKLFNILGNQLDRHLPTIAVVDAIQIQEARTNRNISSNGGQTEHAVVVVGLNDRNVYLNDPWGGMQVPVDWHTFSEAWDVGLNRLITMDLQSTLEDHTEDSA
jgi:hypothetical protein